MGPKSIIRICIFEHEKESILHEAHARMVGGHYQGEKTTRFFKQGYGGRHYTRMHLSLQ